MPRINRRTLVLVAMVTFTTILLSACENKTTSPSQATPQATQLPKVIPSPSPRATPLPQTTTSTYPSPDGKVSLTLLSKTLSTNQASYSLHLKTAEQSTSRLVLEKSLANGANLSVPFNAWSPDNKYFFITEKGPGKTPATVLLYTASGKPFTDEQPYLNVNDLFIAKEIPYRLNEVTGWAAPNLLLVTTKKNETGEDGPSYWFAVSSQSFIQLFTQF